MHGGMPPGGPPWRSDATEGARGAGRRRADLRRSLAYWQGAQARLDNRAREDCPYPETATGNRGSLIGRWRYGYGFADGVLKKDGLAGRVDVENLCREHTSALVAAIGEIDGRVPGELTLDEFAAAVGRSPVTIRRHLRPGGKLHGRTEFRDGRHYFPPNLVKRYLDNLRRPGWDEKKEQK